jgi:hypothetical protein
MVWLARTYLGQDVKAYLDAKYKGSLPKDWDEVERASRPDMCCLIIKSEWSSDLMV